jgi:predicted dehydrogenase
VALSFVAAADLARLARDRSLKLGVAPANVLGPSASAVQAEIASGRLGPIRVVYAYADHGRIERWHPRPEPIFAVGPVLDIGVYPLALLTAVHGPVRQVSAVSARLLATRRTEATSFHLDRDDFTAATLHLADGALAQLTCSFYVDGAESGREGIEFHGDAGSLYLNSCWATHSGVSAVTHDGVRRHIISSDRDSEHIDWALGVSDLIDAVLNDREPRTSAEHAAHLLEVADAITTSADVGHAMPVTSSFPAPFTRRQPATLMTTR